MMRRALCLSLLAGTVGGCTDFDLPSELSRDQIVAVRSSPAVLQPGARAQLDALVASPDGVVDGADLRWSLAAQVSGASIEEDSEGSWLVLADGVAAEAVEVTLEVTTPSGAELAASKVVPIADEMRDNPGPMGLEADGRSIAGGLHVAPGATALLHAELDGVESPQVSWFATVGEIERYRRNPTELVAPPDPDRGWLIAVLRDGASGVTWQVVTLDVE
jgi:hypothetical protein